MPMRYVIASLVDPLALHIWIPPTDRNHEHTNRDESLREYPEENEQ